MRTLPTSSVGYVFYILLTAGLFAGLIWDGSRLVDGPGKLPFWFWVASSIVALSFIPTLKYADRIRRQHRAFQGWAFVLVQLGLLNFLLSLPRHALENTQSATESDLDHLFNLVELSTLAALIILFALTLSARKEPR